MASSGKVVHIELPAQDADRAQRFYAELFGWQFADSGMEGIDYRMFQGEPGGAVYPGENAGQGPIVYFESDDIDAELAKVRVLGGQADDIAEATEALSGDEQEREPDHHGDDTGEGERGKHAHASAQFTHHRGLNGAGEACCHSERDGQSSHRG